MNAKTQASNTPLNTAIPVPDDGTQAKQGSPKGTVDTNNVISHPNDVAAWVMSQMNTVNAKKDEPTIAIKQLADTTQQLVRVYAGHTSMIAQLTSRVKEIEEQSSQAA